MFPNGIRPKRAWFTRALVAAVTAGGFVLGLWSAAGAPLLAEGQGAGAPAGSSLSGTVRSGSSQPLDGIAVSARAAGSTITTSVYTDEAGQYVFPQMASGTYDVWAQAAGFELARVQVVVNAGRGAQHAFTMNTVKDILPHLSSSEWLDALPQRTREDRRMKELFAVNCSECHSLSLALQSPFDEEGWTAVIERMDRMSGSEAFTQGADTPITTLAYHKKELARYLATIRGPKPGPINPRVKPRPRGDAARVVVTEYAIPPAETPDELAWYDGSQWAAKGTAVNGHYMVGVHDARVDNAGNAWFTESVGTGRTLTKVDAKTGKVSGFQLFDQGGRQLRTHGIEKDVNGILWMDDFGRGNLIRLDPATETFKVFSPLPRMGSGASATVDSDAKGFVWTATRLGALRFDPTTEKFRYFQSRTPADGNSYGVAADIDGNGWWTTYWADILTTADVKTGKSIEVPLNPPNAAERAELATPDDKKFYDEIGALSWANINTVPGAIGPRRLGADKHTGTVWVPLFHSAAVAKVDIRTKKPTYYQLPSGWHYPYFVEVDKDSKVWTNLYADDAVAKFDPKTEQWTIYKLPTMGCETRNITVDDIRGEVWVPCMKASKAIRLQFRTPAQLQTERAAAGAPVAGSR